MAWSAVARVAREEWRYWLRSKTALAAGVVTMLLVLASLITTVDHVSTERETRHQFQTSAEDTFRSQPARHPHRMVHYGHYVFRTPAPLAVADPGIDPFTGTVMFLEGHEQNTATFSPKYTQAHAGPYTLLSPALTYQLLVPLLLIVVGFGALSREKEARTDQLVFTMAVGPATFWLGKTLALASLAVLALLPLGVVAVLAIGSGESGVVAAAFWLGYLLYLLCWVFLITAVSAWTRQATTSLLTLLVCWLVFSVVLPRVASSTADAWAPLSGKVQSELEIAREQRNIGDGHNANDVAFAKLRAQLLTQYGVDDVADLPVNFRGVVAQVAEAELTDLLNKFADRRIEQELAQTQIANLFSLFSPYLAIKSFSINTASTNLGQYHRYVRAAEATRFEFVQGLNKVHANDLDYTVDINRSIDAASERKSRVDAHHWRVLSDFDPPLANVSQRLGASFPYLAVLVFWLVAAGVAGRVGVVRNMYG